MTKLYGSLEAGGTKFVCAVGDENFNVVEKDNFQQQLPIKQSIKPSSSFQNSIILLVLPLVHLVQSISIKIQKLTDLSQQLQNLTGQMWTCLVLFVAL